MISRLSSLIDTLWESNLGYKERYTKKEVEERQLLLLESSYCFDSMLRSFIPKPKKPGQFRPITQPAEKDRLVLDALFCLFT
jgi:retron-type reverse transcriptase